MPSIVRISPGTGRGLKNIALVIANMPGVCYYFFTMISIVGMTRNLLHRSAFIALFAVLLNALAPTLSYAMAAGKGMAVVEMCTSFGLKKVLVSNTDGSDSSSTQGIKHCPFCLSADSPPPAPAEHSATLFLSPETLPVVVSGRQIVHNPLLSWSAAHKRGPPSLA